MNQPNPKYVLYGDNLRKSLLEGVSLLNKAVSTTLGPRGRNVCIDRQLPLITKDGATVAREVDLGYGPVALGASIMKESSTRTATSSGDGTTTTTILAHALYDGLQKCVSTGHNPIFLARGVQRASSDATCLIQERARPVTSSKEISQVATLCSNGDSALGDLIAEAMEASGKDGVISVVEGNGPTTTLEFAEGYQLDRGYHTPEYLTVFDPDATGRGKMTLVNPLVLVVNKKMSNIQDYLSTLEYTLDSARPLLIFAHDFEGDFLTTLNYNVLQDGRIKALMIKMPRFAEKRTWLLGDIAALTGAVMLDDDMGIKPAKMKPEEFLGSCGQVDVTVSSTVMIDGAGSDEDIYERVRQIRSQADRSPSEHDKEFHLERASALSGGLTLIKLGGNSDLAVKEYRARVEDALSATRVSIEQGIVPGGSSTLVYVAQNLKNPFKPGTEEYLGFDIFVSCLVAPFQHLIRNAGGRAEYILGCLQDKLNTNPNSAFNVRTMAWVEDAFEEGLVDPAKVLIDCIRYASSSASTLSTVEAAILLANKEG